ncbi:Phosphatidylglycerophosphate phosphatase PTPMT1 [Linum grandiflorum]
MIIEEENVEAGKLGVDGGVQEDSLVVWDAKRVLIGAGARALFYPTLVYNVVRNKCQAEFRWWDRVDKYILLGAVPFPGDVPRLKELGVGGVVTMNEPYETLVPTALYHEHGIDHLVLPTRDYCFAPSLRDIYRAVEFIHVNALQGRTTYVHCKAGRGRSTTIVLCYLVQHKHMTPQAAYDHVKSIRPRVLLASPQRQAVEEFYLLKVKTHSLYRNLSSLFLKTPRQQGAEVFGSKDLVAFDDGSVVVVTEADLDGYDPRLVSSSGKGDIWADLSVVYGVRVAGQAVLARISCLWLHSQKLTGKQLSRKSSCSISTDQLGGISVDIHVY